MVFIEFVFVVRIILYFGIKNKMKFEPKDNTLWYLASPYSSIDPNLMESRYKKVLGVTERLLMLGYNVFSPIVYSHHIATITGVTKFSDWQVFDFLMLAHCQGFMVLVMDGLQESVGVAAELKEARRLDKTILFLDPHLNLLRVNENGQ